MKVSQQLLEKCGIKSFKHLLNEKRDHTKAIRKFANVDEIVEWANVMDKDLALWLADKITKLIKKSAKEHGWKEEFNYI